VSKSKSTVGAVIVAAGSSQRMSGGDKLFTPLCGETVLARVITVFQKCKAIDQIAVVVREDKVEEVIELVTEREWSKVVDVCAGGERRQDSVQAGLDKVKKCDLTVVHDGARPLVTAKLIEQGLEVALDTEAAAAAMPATDTIKVVGPDGTVHYTPSRDSLWAVQTPQVFRTDLLRKAYRRVKEEVSDDATAVEQFGHRVVLYRGSHDNIKITTLDDFVLAEALLKNRG